MSNAVTAPPSKSSRRPLLILIALTVLPMVAAWAMYFFFPPSARSNYGTLLEVRPVPDVALASVDDKPFHLKDLRGKWVLINVERASCPQSCQYNLFALRQARVMQGREQPRLERVWLMTDSGAPESKAVALMDGARIVRISGSDASAVLAGEPGVEGHAYLVDPLGNLVLRFPSQPEPKKVAKDLKRLLKASNIG